MVLEVSENSKIDFLMSGARAEFYELESRADACMKYDVCRVSYYSYMYECHVK